MNVGYVKIAYFHLKLCTHLSNFSILFNINYAELVVTFLWNAIAHKLKVPFE